MESGRLQRHNASDPGEREIVDHLVEHFDTYPRELVVNYYIALKTKHFVVLAGPPDVDKESLAQGLAEALVGRPGLQWSLIQAHPWWATRTRAPRQLAEAHARFNSLKVYDFIEAASASEHLGLPFSFLAGIKDMSPAEVVCYFEDLPRGLFWRADGTITRIDLPGNLFVTGTLNTTEHNMPLLSAQVHRHAIVIRLVPDRCAPASGPDGPSGPKLDWQQTLITSGVGGAEEARAKLSRILPGGCAPLVEMERFVRRLGLPRLPSTAAADAWLYLANAFDLDGHGLFVDSVVENLTVARDYAMTQSVLPLISSRWLEAPQMRDTIGEHLVTRFPRAYARCLASRGAGSSRNAGVDGRRAARSPKRAIGSD